MSVKFDKPVQVVCFSVLQSQPIHKEYDGQHVTYTALRFYFHSWYKKKSNPLIIASQYLPYKNYGVASSAGYVQGTHKDLRGFLSCWSGDNYNDEDVYSLTIAQIKAMSIGVNAIIECEIVERVTLINSIGPCNTEKQIWIKPVITIPAYLLPEYKTTNKPKKLKLPGDEFMAAAQEEIQELTEELTELKRPY